MAAVAGPDGGPSSQSRSTVLVCARRRRRPGHPVHGSQPSVRRARSHRRTGGQTDEGMPPRQRQLCLPGM